MNELESIVAHSGVRMFSDPLMAEALSALEAGSHSTAAWALFEASGMAGVLSMETDNPEASCDAARALLHAAGLHHAPLPVVESLMANHLLERCGLTIPEGMPTCSPAGGLRAQMRDGRMRVSGSIEWIGWARHASYIAVPVALPDREAVAVIATQAAGVSCVPGQNAAAEPRDRLDLSGVAAEAFAPLDDAHAEALALGALCTAAAMSGAAEAVLDMTARYASERRQFGRPIAKLQAIQQPLAVLAGEVASAVAACRLAFRALSSGVRVDAPETWVAKIRAGHAATLACAVGHQVHGAIGITREYPLHRLTRRLLSWRAEYGHEAAWARRLGEEVIGRKGAGLWPFVAECGRSGARHGVGRAA